MENEYLQADPKTYRFNQQDLNVLSYYQSLFIDKVDRKEQLQINQEWKNLDKQDARYKIYLVLEQMSKRIPNIQNNINIQKVISYNSLLKGFLTQIDNNRFQGAKQILKNDFFRNEQKMYQILNNLISSTLIPYQEKTKCESYCSDYQKKFRVIELLQNNKDNLRIPELQKEFDHEMSEDFPKLYQTLRQFEDQTKLIKYYQDAISNINQNLTKQKLDFTVTVQIVSNLNFQSDFNTSNGKQLSFKAQTSFEKMIKEIEISKNKQCITKDMNLENINQKLKMHVAYLLQWFMSYEKQNKPTSKIVKLSEYLSKKSILNKQLQQKLTNLKIISKDKENQLQFNRLLTKDFISKPNIFDQILKLINTISDQYLRKLLQKRFQSQIIVNILKADQYQYQDKPIEFLKKRCSKFFNSNSIILTNLNYIKLRRQRQTKILKRCQQKIIVIRNNICGQNIKHHQEQNPDQIKYYVQLQEHINKVHKETNSKKQLNIIRDLLNKNEILKVEYKTFQTKSKQQLKAFNQQISLFNQQISSQILIFSQEQSTKQQKFKEKLLSLSSKISFLQSQNISLSSKVSLLQSQNISLKAQHQSRNQQILRQQQQQRIIFEEEKRKKQEREQTEKQKQMERKNKGFRPYNISGIYSERTFPIQVQPKEKKEEQVRIQSESYGAQARLGEPQKEQEQRQTQQILVQVETQQQFVQTQFQFIQESVREVNQREETLDRSGLIEKRVVESSLPLSQKQDKSINTDQDIIKENDELKHQIEKLSLQISRLSQHNKQLTQSISTHSQQYLALTIEYDLMKKQKDLRDLKDKEAKEVEQGQSEQRGELQRLQQLTQERDSLLQKSNTLKQQVKLLKKSLKEIEQVHKNEIYEVKLEYSKKIKQNSRSPQVDQLKYQKEIQLLKTQVKQLKQLNERLKKDIEDAGKEKEKNRVKGQKEKQTELTKMKEQYEKKLKTYEFSREISIQTVDTRFLLADRFFSGRILSEDYKKKYFLKEQIEQNINKKIKKTELLYRFDQKNTTNFHEYIDGINNICLIVKTQKNIFGAFSEEKFEKGHKQSSLSKAFIFTFNSDLCSGTGLTSFDISYEKENAKSLTYDDYYIIVGNSELRLKLGEALVYSNFGIQNGYYKPNESKVSALFKSGNNREVDLKSYEVHQVIFEQEQKQEERFE